MKVDASSHGSRPRDAVVSRPAPTSFRALIGEEPWSAGDRPDQAVGFDALGVFGQVAAMRDEAGPSKTRTPRPAASPGPPASASAPSLSVSSLAPLAVPASPVADLQSASAPVDILEGLRAPSRRAQASNPASAEVCASEPQVIDAASDDADVAPQTERPNRSLAARRDQSAASEKTPGLTLVGETNGTVVVVSGLALSRDALEDFRTSARTILARQGLSLYKLIVNGADRSADPHGKGIEPWR